MARLLPAQRSQLTGLGLVPSRATMDRHGLWPRDDEQNESCEDSRRTTRDRHKPSLTDDPLSPGTEPKTTQGRRP